LSITRVFSCKKILYWLRGYQHCRSLHPFPSLQPFPPNPPHPLPIPALPSPNGGEAGLGWAGMGRVGREDRVRSRGGRHLWFSREGRSCSVSNATLNRFFSLHYILPFVLAALVVAHLMALHIHGSNNPNGVQGGGDRYSFYPYFIFKDLVTIFAFFLVLSIFVFYYPNALGHSDNYIPANPMVTPASIVPEWY